MSVLHKLFGFIFLANILLINSPASYAQGHQQAVWVGEQFDGGRCSGDISSSSTDYLKAANVAGVEKVHFTHEVESLARGATSSNPADDLRYMLNKFPNHHRALNSRINLQLNSKLYKWPQRHIPSAECYLQRAINFSPKDATSRMLYGILLHRSGKHEEALVAYKQAEDLSPSEMQIKYNIGLLLFEMESYKQSADYATVVYDNKFPLMGLQNKLKKQGHWPAN